MAPSHKQWMYRHDLHPPHHAPPRYVRIEMQKKLTLVATWGGYGNDPGYFISPCSVHAFESVPKRWTEQHMVVDDDDGSDPMALPLTIKVVVADPGNSRVQILEHRVHFSSKLSSVIEKKSGCCIVS